MTEWNLPMTGELAKRMQEETIKNFQRVWKGMDLVYHPREPQVGQTLREPIHKRNKSILYRYGLPADRRHPVPVLMVPNLGISRPYIFRPVPRQQLYRAHGPARVRFLPSGLGRLRR